MATVLSQQLQQLSLQRGAVAPTTKGKATLLFDNQAAADVDLQTLHGIATVGLKKLAARDGRYLPFLSGLFSEASLQTPSREQQSEEWNQELNDSVLSFLRLLSIHFLLPPSFQVLEYLVRKYKINEYNVDGVMECILPYHATNEFVRVVQILRLKNTIWSSLSKAQETGAALPRDVLVQRCCVDRAILKFICEAAKIAASPSYTNKTMLSFYTVVVFEVLGKSKQVNEELVGFLLPYALEGLKPNAMTDHRHASYTIIARLTSVVALSGSLISLLVEQLIAAGQPDETPAILRLLAHMAATQGELKSISGKPLKRLVSLPGFAQSVAELAGPGGRAGPLLRLLLKSLAGRVLSGRAWAAAALTELAAAAPLADHAGALATQLLQGVPDIEQDGKDTRDAVTKVLRALDLRYSEQLDQAINNVLAASSTTAQEQGAAEAVHSRKAAVFEFVRTAFEHSMHATLGAGADRAVTLSVALDAPAAGMRAEAVKQLDEVFVVSTLPEQRAFATASLLRKLRDDDLAVVSVALSSRAVASAAPAVLLDELRAVLARADEVLLADSGREKGKLKAARDVAQKALQLLVTSQQDHPEGHMVAAAYLLDHMLVTPRGCDVTHTAVALARTSHGHPLFSRLLEVPLPVQELAPAATPSEAAPSGESARPKKAKKQASLAPEHDADAVGALTAPSPAAIDAALNSSVIESLAQAVAQDLSATNVSELPALAAAGGPLCRHHQVLAMTRAAALVDRKDFKASWLPMSLATGLHAVFRSDWPAFQDALPSQLFAYPSWKRLAPGSEEHLGQLATAAGRGIAHASALQVAMLHVAGQSLALQNLQIFAEVAQLEPQAAFEAHLRKLLPAVAGSMGAAGDVGTALQQLQYLAEFFGDADGAWPEAVVVRALQCAALLLQRNAAAVAAMPLLRVVLCVLTAMSSASGKVRKTAADSAPAVVAALLALAADSAASAMQCGEGITVAQAASALAAVLASVPGYAAEIAASPSAITQRLSSFLSSSVALGASPPADTAVAATPTKQPPPGAAETPASARRSRRGKPASQAMEVEGAAAPPAADHQQPTNNGHALRMWMLHALRDCHAGAAGMVAAACLAVALAATPACHESLVHVGLDGDPPALPIRRALLLDEQSPLAADAVKPNLTGDEARVVMAIVSCLGPSSVHLASLRQPLLELAVALVSARHAPSSVTLQNLRLALLGKLAGDLKDLFAEAKGAELAPLRVELLRSLLLTAGGDPSQDVRHAAHAVLEAVALSSTDVLALLTQQQEEHHMKRKRRRAAAGKLPSPEVVLDHLDEVVLVLELLQWKALDRPQALVAPLEQLLRQLAVAAAPLAVAFTEVDEEEDGEAMEGVGGQDAAPKSATSGYALQLVIGLLNTLAKSLPASEAAIDISGVVLCARNAADAAASNAALQLLATLAARHPEDALKHALMVVEIVYQSEGSLSSLDNTQSRAAAAAVMSAMLPPWLASQGGDAGRLWSLAVDALPSAQPSQRLGLLSMLLTAMPKEHGVTVAVLQLLRGAAAAAANGAAAAAAAPDAAAALTSEECMALANDLFAQVPLDERLQALAELLARSLEEAGGQQPHDVVPRLAVALATTQVKALPRRAAVQGGCEEAVAAGCQALMRQALEQLPALSVLSAAAPARKQRLAVSAATSALYTLIEALDTLMPATAYLESLSTLLQQAQEDRMRRRLLKLLAARLQSLQDGDELELAGAQDQGQQLANAALLLTEALPVLLSPAASSAATRQLALGTLGSAARCFAALAPAPLLGAVPAVLGAVRDELGAVRGSALVCVAALATSLQQRMLPLLPQVVATVLEVTEAAQRSLAGLDTTEQPPAADKDEASSEDEEGAAEPMSREATVEERAVELAGGLAALDALLRALGAFLSPYLPALLQLLLRPEVLRCEVAGCSRFAAAIRGRIPEAVPPRLLLDPLFKQLQPAMEAGRAPALALLQMAADTVAAMDTKTAAAYHEQLFACVLRALDVREGGAMDREDAAAVEGAAVEVLLALVMKLSERLFKPLFLRLLTWASVTPDTLAEDGTAVAPRPVGRLIALFSASAALGRRLRSVFVPYLRYLLDVAVQQLGGADGLEAGASQTKKKRKKAAAAEGPPGIPAASPPDAGMWLLRLKVLRALHRGLLHDTVGFLTPDRFERLLPVLVAQLEVAPPAELQAQLAEEVVDEELDGTLLPAKHLSLDPAGRVAVAAVVQLALTANSDVLWKPLQHRALMLTRSAEPRCRLAALEVVGQLAARLREEYLTLMPEALPFLAELLEDVEPTVEGRAQELVALLEEVSGEKLDQYLKA